MSRWTLLARLYCLFYRSVVTKEIALANITSSDQVLCVGGGPIPATAMLIAKTGAKVDVIDCDPHVISHSQALIERMGLDHSVRILQGNGVDINLQGFSVVHIARQVAPRHRVVSNVTEGMEPEARVVLRVPPKALAALYDSDRCWHKNCHLAQRCQQNHDSLLLTRRKKYEEVAAPSGRAAIGSSAPLVG